MAQQISISDTMAYQLLINSFARGDWGDTNAIGTFAYSGYQNTRTHLTLMKGTVPTDFSALTNYSTSRSTDILVDWTTSNGAGWSSDGVKTIWFNGTDMQYATASGTATWLWWRVQNWISPSNIDYQAIFTVGVLGSGSDYELISTTVTQGNGYRLVNGPRITIPTEWNY